MHTMHIKKPSVPIIKYLRIACLALMFSFIAACKPTTPVPTVFREAADVVEKSVDSAPAPVGVLNKEGEDNYQRLRTLMSEYRRAVSASWTDNVVPLLRTIYTTYEELRLSGLPLPKLPSFIGDLVMCPKPTPPPSEPPIT